MSDFTFTVALGVARYYAEQVAAGTGQLHVVLLKSAAQDATLRTQTTLAAVLAGGSAEADWTGGTAYARKQLAVADGLEITPNGAQVDVDIDDLTWANAGVSTDPKNLSDLLICYAPPSASGDGDLIPLTCHDYPEIANGADITATIADSGFYRAAG